MSTTWATDGWITTSYYDPGYIALSYVVSLMGCVTSLEMLHRRTSRSGAFNWYLLLTSSITMGGIGIWCMHFIGNRAIVLGNGEGQLQISYNVAFTAVSFALPVVVLLVAFYAISFEEKATTPRLLSGGLLAGGAVCGMHYVGQLGIDNYLCRYQIGNVIGAAIIAAVSATLALSVFFRWKAAWNDSWWRRCICGALLACAVTGMHYTAAVGTTYKPKTGDLPPNKELSRRTTVIVCAVLACVSCIILIFSAAVAGRSRRRSKLRSRQLVLSCAFFDPAGRIMVTPQALLPTRKISEHYIGQNSEFDEFSRSHPDFLWAFRATRNWDCVRDMVPFMRTQLQADESLSKRSVRARPSTSDVEKKTAIQPTPHFKQSFCVSAQDLADELHLPLHQLGMLYNNVLTTAIETSRLRLQQALPRVGKGQLMFTVRHLSREEAAQFAASGFGFAPIERIKDTLAQRTRLSAEQLQAHLHEMRDYESVDKGFTPGVHLVAFALRPTMRSHFEVLTTRAKGSSLPSRTLPIDSLTSDDLQLISDMDEWTVPTCLKWLRSASTGSGHSLADEFRSYLFNALLELSSTLPQDLISGARFSSRVLSAPCRRPSSLADLSKEEQQALPQNCTLLSIRVIVPLGTRLSDPDLRFIPLRLFRVEEEVNGGPTDRERFAREFNDEFSYCVQTTVSQPANTTKSTLSKLQHHRSTFKEKRRSFSFAFWPRKGDLPFEKKQWGHLRTRRLNSQESLVEMTSQTTTTTKSGGGDGMGDIVISKEVRVNVAQLGTTDRDSHLHPPHSPSLPPPPPSPTTLGESGPPSRASRDSATEIPSVPSLHYAAYGNGTGNNSNFTFAQNYVDGLYSMCFSPGIRMKPSELPESYDSRRGSMVEE